MSTIRGGMRELRYSARVVQQAANDACHRGVNLEMLFEQTQDGRGARQAAVVALHEVRQAPRQCRISLLEAPLLGEDIPIAGCFRFDERCQIEEAIQRMVRLLPVEEEKECAS